MIYFEDARLEFWGHPVAWMPYFSAPDPTVKRKTGVLVPTITSSSVYGQAIEVPYYWALAPDYDATLAPMITTKQGPMLQGEFRQRLINGAYSIRAAGIYQLDKGYFTSATGENAPGYRDFRGSVESSGQFALTDKWVWGWDGIAMTDKTFLQDYNPHLSRYTSSDPFLSGGTSEGISQLYLTGKGNRSYFDVRSIYYLGFSDADAQGQIPVIHPVLDYNYTFDHPVLDGELGYDINFTSLTRQSANFDAITQTALNNNTCTTTADSRHPDAGELRAARHSRHLQPFLGGNPLAPQRHRLDRRSLYAVRIGARRRRLDANQFRPGRLQLHQYRRDQPGARHADGRPRIPFSVHQH